MNWRHRVRRRAFLCVFCVLACACLPVRGLASTNYPAWWSALDVLETNRTVNDYAPAVAGQLKWVVAKAYNELQANLPGGAGTGVAGVVSSFTTCNNYVPVNVGQLKYVAEPFYQQLIAKGYPNAFPWTTSTDDDANYSPASLGQVKNVFSFDVTKDSDDDDLPDWWEIHWFGGVAYWTGIDNPDGDQLNNTNEYLLGTNPTINDNDTDGDGMSDGQEVLQGYDPATSNAAAQVWIRFPAAGRRLP